MRSLFLALSVWLSLCCAVSGDAIAQGPPNFGTVMTPNQAAGASININRSIVSVLDSGAACNGTTDDTTAIQNAINNNPGQFILIPPAACKISSTLTITSNFTVLGAFTDGQTGHDIGTNCSSGPRLVWAGTSGVTMVQASAVPGAGNQALSGAGVQGISFCGGGTAGIGLQILSARQGMFTNLYFEEMTVAGLDLATIQSGTLGEASDTQSNYVANINGRQINNAAPIIRWHGSPAVAGNVSFNTFVNIGGQYKNAPALYCQNADNNRVIGTHFTRVSGGTAIGLLESNDANGYCRNNTFYNGSWSTGGSEFRGGITFTVGGTATTNDVVTINFASTLAGFPISPNYTVVGGNTTTNIAAGLVTALNGNATFAAGWTASSSGAVVTITPNNVEDGEVTASYTQGGNTETITFTPTDAVMVGQPTIDEMVIGTDVTNGDPAPTIGVGAQLMWQDSQGTTHFLRQVSSIFATNSTNAATAFPRLVGSPLAYEYDPTQGGHWGDDGTSKFRLIWDNLHNYNLQRQTTMGGWIAPSMFTTTADDTVNTAAATSVFGTGIGTQNNSNVIGAGTKYHMTSRGFYTTPAANAATITPKVMWGATTVSTGSAATMPASQTNSPIWFDVDCTIRSLGTSGTISCNGGMYYNNAGVITYVDMSTTTPQTINTTTTNKLDMTITWSSVAGAQSATFNQGTYDSH